MAQLENPTNLDQFNDSDRRLITLILIRCGLRLGGLGLSLGCWLRRTLDHTLVAGVRVEPGFTGFLWAF